MSTQTQNLGAEPTIHRSACILCTRNCGLEIEVREGAFTRIRGDRAHPLSAGYLCQKAARLEHYQNHADRLTRPLRRRLDGGFEAVSWEQALAEIAGKLLALRREHGGKCFAFYGGGGQGNHLGAVYTSGLLRAMGSPYRYNALAQEKTGDFWVNGRLFGRQDCHVSEDIEHADYVLFIGTNPWQAHGIPNARDLLRTIAADPTRKMAVIDPRRTETAKLADEHLQLRPGTDAFLISAMLAILMRDGMLDRDFIARHTHGFDELAQVIARVPIERYVEQAGLRVVDVQRVARGFAAASRACVRVDLGIHQSLHSTLNSYLEKLLFLLTGNFGKQGGNNLHTFFLPFFGHSPEGVANPRSTVCQMPAISRLFPPNLLPAEIDTEHPGRIRALFVDSANPVVSGADTAAYERAMSRLELLVVVDVAMTETARFAHYVLPAASQFEKWEATGFNLEFPRNHFHLRAPIVAPLGESLPEPEIYTRLLRALGELPAHGFGRLAKIAQSRRRPFGASCFLAAFAALLGMRSGLRRYAVHILYETLGPSLPDGAAAAAPLWILAHRYAWRYRWAVRRAGFLGTGLGLGEALFDAILRSRSGTVISQHRYEEVWSLLGHADRKIRLHIPELCVALDALGSEPEPSGDFPFVLIAGERRTYNANTIYRNPEWRRNDRQGALAIHPEDAATAGLKDGGWARCRSAHGEIEVAVCCDDRLRRGVVSLPHGYGLRYQDGAPEGPYLNRLTAAAHRDVIAGTPLHKYVRVQLQALPHVQRGQSVPKKPEPRP